jgi:tRNA(Ile)-lysidine synthase
MSRTGRSSPANGSEPSGDSLPVSHAEAARLFSELKHAQALVLAVSGGPDSTALMWLAALWRKRIRRGPKLIAVTIDHGLRKQSAAEARAVKALAVSLGMPHATLRWSGEKPSTGIPAAAREARYALLTKAARKAGAVHVVTAHTRDDQAETFLMRLSRGSGLAGLSAMAATSARDGVVIVRPLLDVPKARLIATLAKAKVAYADDPTNRDPSFTRPRWRQLLPLLAQEGVDGRNIARLTERLARANAALEAISDRTEAALMQYDGGASGAMRECVDARTFLTLPQEIRLRLLHRMIDRLGHEGPAELGKVETLLDSLVDALAVRGVEAIGRTGFKRTLAGAIVSSRGGTICVEAAPLRRSARGPRRS